MYVAGVLLRRRRDSCRSDEVLSQFICVGAVVAARRIEKTSTDSPSTNTQVKPDEKKHPKFANVANVTMKLFDRDAQLGTGIVASMTCGDAVAKGTIANLSLIHI